MNKLTLFQSRPWSQKTFPSAPAPTQAGAGEGTAQRGVTPGSGVVGSRLVCTSLAAGRKTSSPHRDTTPNARLWVMLPPGKGLPGLDLRGGNQGTPNSRRVCSGTCVFQVRFLLSAKASPPRSPACLFQPGWMREISPPPLPLHLTQKMFENPRFLPSPASPPLGNRRLKEKQTKASLCSGELTGRGAATPPLLLLPSRGSGLPIVCRSSGHVKGSFGLAFTSAQGLGLIGKLLILIIQIVVCA